MSGFEDEDQDAPAGANAPRTVFAPSPGGARPPEAGQAPRAAPTLGALEAESSRPGVNPLVDAAADLFDLVVYLRAQAMPIDVAPVRDKTVALIRQFERRALDSGEEPKVVSAARYAIAATIDDQVISLPWGIDSGWANRRLVEAVEGDVIGGERFYEYLEAAQRDPRRFKSLIEFLYICLSLGFKGQFRRDSTRAQGEHDSQRTKAYRVIEDVRGGQFADRLSIRWKGVDTIRRPVSDLLPNWLLAALSFGLLAALLFMFVWFVGDHVVRVDERVRTMPPYANGARQLVTVERFARPPPEPVVPLPLPPAPQEEDWGTGIYEFLDPEIRQRLVEVEPDGRGLRIRLIGDTMFDSGSVDVNPTFQGVIERVASALNDEPGQVLIEGYTDSIQPARTAAIPTNRQLSEERALAVERILTPLLVEQDRLTSTGYGELNPIAGNDTREGRARNRRVELLLIRPDETSTTSGAQQ